MKTNHGNNRSFAGRMEAPVSALVAILFLVTSNDAGAAQNSFSTIGPDGGTVYDLKLAPSNPSIMYAAAPSGFYRSDDGNTWRLLVSSLVGRYLYPVGIEVDPTNANNVSMIVNGGAYFSSDGGATLTGAGLAANAYLTTSTRDGSAIYRSDGGIVYRSTNHGANWTKSGNVPTTDGNTYLLGLQSHPTNGLVVYAATLGGRIYRSDDAGVTWLNLFTLPPAPFVDNLWAFTVDSNNPTNIWVSSSDKLWVTHDGGVNWQSTALNDTVMAITVDPTNSSIVYTLRSLAGLVRSIDGGATWTNLSLPGTYSGLRRILVDPTNPNRLYLYGSDNGVLISSNSGATWNSAHKGIGATAPLGFVVTASQRIFVPIRGAGLYNVADDGLSTGAILAPTLSFVSGAEPAAISQVVSVSQPEYFVALLANQKIARTRVGFDNWTTAAEPPTGVQIFGLGASSRWPSVFAATSGGLYRSTDYGDHWSLSNGGIPNGLAVNSIGTTTSQNLLFASVAVSASNGLGDSTIYKSTDAGANWTPTSLVTRSVTRIATSPADERITYVTSNAGFFKTVDGGSSWSPVQLVAGATACCMDDVIFDAANPAILYAVSNQHVYRSINSGASFQRITGDYDVLRVNSLLVNPRNSNQILVAMDGGGVRELTIAPDLSIAAVSSLNTAQPGSQIEITVTAKNNSPFEATNASVNAQLDGSLTGITSVSASGGACTITGNSVACRYDILMPKQEVSIRIPITTTSAGSIRTSSTINADQPDAAMSNNAASVTTTVATPAVSDSNSGGGGALSWSSLLMLLASLFWKILSFRTTSLRTVKC